MFLLDIPPELFQQIARDLVDVAGITEAWKLRLVCRSFAADISYEVLFKRPKTAFVGDTETRFLHNAMDRYLLARLRVPLDANKAFLDKVQRMIDWAVTQRGGNTTGVQDDTTETICTGLLNVVGGFELSYAIEPDSLKFPAESSWWAEQDLNIHDKLIAALSVGDYELVEKLLPELIDGPKCILWLAMAPFDVAIRKRDMTLFHITLRFLQNVAASDAFRTVSLQKTKAGGHEPFNVASAISTATACKRHGMLQALLQFSDKHLPRPSNHTYNSWISIAVSSGEDFLHTLLNYKPKRRSMVIRQTLNTVCLAGTANMIQAVASILGNEMNNGSIITLPIFVAVRSGRPEAVEALFNAGADISVKAISNIRTLAKTDLTPLDVAIYHQKLDVVDVLIACGAGPLPRIQEWPHSRRTYNHLRRIVHQTNGTDLPPWQKFRNLSLEAQQSIVF